MLLHNKQINRTGKYSAMFSGEPLQLIAGLILPDTLVSRVTSPK